MPMLISDGYTFRDAIPARPPVWGEVKYAYRPALLKERHEWLHTENAKGRTALAVRLIRDHLKEITEDGQPVDLGATAAERAKLAESLHPEIITHVVDRILGYSGPAEIDDAKN